MNLWGPVPLALLYDLRVRGLSWAERGVLHHLYLLASTSHDRRTIVFPLRPGEAHVSAWKRTLGDDGSEAVGRLVESGLAEIVPEGLRTTIEALQPSRGAYGGLRDAEGEVTPSSAPRAPKDPVAALRAAFSDKDLGNYEERAAWLATEAGAATVARYGLTPAQALEVAAGAGRRGPRAGVRRESAESKQRVSRKSADESAEKSADDLSPSHSPSQRDQKEKGNARGKGSAESAGKSADESAGSKQTSPQEVRRDLPHPDPLVALQATGKAVLYGGGEADASALLLRMKVTGLEVDLMARALERPAAWWPDPKRAPARATLGDLLGFRTADGYEAKALTALVAHVRSVDSSAPVASAARAPVRVDAGDSAEAVRLLTEAKARRTPASAVTPDPKETTSHVA